ncbi:MAG: nucleotidyltransferase domain-containing protein [Victivallaceae bacterium]
MVKINQIKRYVKQISEEFHPEKVILFGSYAYGRPTPDSDVDLLVVMEDQECTTRPSLEIRRRINAPFSLDLIVKSPSHIKKRLKMRDYFIRDIIEKGVVLYER